MMRVPESWKQTYRALTANSYSSPGEVKDQVCSFYHMVYMLKVNKGLG